MGLFLVPLFSDDLCLFLLCFRFVSQLRPGEMFSAFYAGLPGRGLMGWNASSLVFHNGDGLLLWGKILLA